MSKQGEAGQFTRHRRAIGLMVGLGMVLASTSFSWAALTTSYPFQDRKLPLETRLNDLVGRLTLDEKLSMFHQHTPAIARLGVPAFRPGTEGLHGISWLGKATVFPQATGYGCTWDTQLIKKIGAVVGDEARGYHLKDEVLNGLAVWAPVVDLERDPRAGRFEEGYGEDPFLVGQLAIAYCKGIKGDDPFYYKAIPTLKHFYAYNQEANRDTISVALDERNKNEYYLKSFRYPIEAGVAKSLMTSYNLVNGIPCTIAPEVNIAKNQWTKGKDFYVVTDAFAPNNLTASQAYFKTGAESHAAMIKAGIDSMTQDSADPTGTINNIKTALDKGMITVADIDRGVRNILRVRFHLGDFDADTKDNPYDKLTTDEICAPDHSKLALQAAQKQLVLLKNDQNFLPLQKKAVRKVAVIGPLADQVFTDFYSAPFPYTKTVLNGVQGKVTAAKVVFSRGVDQIALKSTANNCYVTAPAAGGQLAATAQNVSTNETYDLYDFGWGQYLLRSAANDKYLSGNGNVLNTANAPGVQADGIGKQDWFTWQNFNMECQSDGTYTLYNYQVSHWDTALTGGKYVTVAADTNLLTASAATIGGNEKFQKLVLAEGKGEAAKAASGADVAIVVVGNQPMLNGRETLDRTDIVLPPSQEELIKRVAAVNQNTIVVVVSSYPMALGAISQNPNIKAILYSSHGGQEEGTAIADALFGDYAPAGRLNATWYSSVDQLPAITDYDIIKGKRTYMYFEGKPLYPFGYGLTYTTFKYSDLRTIRSGEKAIVQVKVKNTGKVASDEVVQLYVKAPQGKVKRALKELKGFKRIHLKPGESELVRLNLPIKELAYWDVTRKDFYVEPGVYQVMVGRSSADIQVKGNLKVCSER